MVLALPASHPAAGRDPVDLADVAGNPLLLFPREVGPTLYDTIVGAFRTAGFEPQLGQTAPQIASVVNLVAAALGVSMVPASMSQLAVAGVVYRRIEGNAPTARIALAIRSGQTGAIVRNFVARATNRPEDRSPVGQTA